MKYKYQEFFNRWNGQYCEVNDPTNKYQCMDLAYAFLDFLEIPRDTIRHLYAKEVYTKATDLTKKYFDLIPNAPDNFPKVGDLVVFNEKIGGVAGHIAISNGVGDANTFESFDQNYGTPKYCRIVVHNYKAVIGWLRPTIEIDDCDTPNWFTTLLTEKGLSLDREGEFRAFWDKAVKYDDDTTSLKEQVKSSNEALADRALEVSALTTANQKLSDAAGEAQDALNKARSERDQANWEKEKLAIEVKTLTEENTSLKESNANLEDQIKTAIKDYSAKELFALLLKKLFRK